MNAIFVDTAGWTACADAGDPAHLESVDARDTALASGARLITTDFVVDETLTLLRIRLGVRAAQAWWRQIDASHRLRWERIDAGRFDRAREMFFRFKDKDFSFTDCTSFVVMGELHLTRALTTDRHFKQAGFTIAPLRKRG
jgi:predicted nucleic acid-binding protein